MDRFKRKRKKDTGQKKVLLSIVDPWDDRLASVDPVGLAKRRGVSLSALPSYRDDCSNSEWPTYGSPVRIPSPWYKPPSSTTTTTTTGSSISSPPPYQRTFSQETSNNEQHWSHPWYLEYRSPSPSPTELCSTSRSSFDGSVQYSENDSPRDNVRPSSTTCSPSSVNELIGSSSRGVRDGRSEDAAAAAAVIARIHYENERKNESSRSGSSEDAAAAAAADIPRIHYVNERENESSRSARNSPIPLVLVTRPPDEEETDRISPFPVPAKDVEPVFTRNSPKLVEKCAESAPNGFDADELDFGLNGNDNAESERLIDGEASVVDIVQTLVESRYSPVTAAKRRANRISSVRRHQFLKDAFLTGNSKFDSQSTGSFDTEEDERRETIANETSGTAREFGGPIRRKTSISMPSKLDEMNDLANNRQQGTASQFTRVGSASSSSVTFSNSGSTPNGSALGSETEEEANDEELVKVPLQAPPRKKGRSVSPSITPKMGRDPMEIPGVQSANSTITSVNSISSLLKEKLQLSIPQALRRSKKRQNADYRLRAFVGILFLCVVFLVGFAHIYYTQHVLQRAYFDKFRFNKNERAMHIYSNTGAEIIAAKLGVGIPADTGVYPCLPQHQSTNAVCLEWLQQARLYLGHTRKTGMHCYHVIWQSLSPYYNPTDCFDWSLKRGHWYGAGQIQNMPYPLERGRLEFSPFITGDIRKHPFGNVLKRYFLNSKGSTVLVDSETPLYVSINANRSTDFCLQAKHDSFAYINHLTPLPQLNYTICSTDNMKSLHSLMAEKTLWDGLKPDELQAVHSLLSEPVWQISPTNEVLTYNYTEDVMALGFFKQGHVLLSEEWQPSMGDFMLDEERFPTMVKTIDIIHRRGFKIVFTIQPFISTESVNFRDAVANRLLISERGSDPRIPALTRYKQSNSAGVLDITNNKTLPWLQTKLESLITKYKMDSFYLDLGTAQDMPHYYKCEQPLTNPDHYKTLFANSILSVLPVIGVSSAISRPRAPVFVSLPPFPSSWKAIKTVIPTVLSYGVIGFPFIMPGAVGGDVALPMSDNNPDNDFEVSLPDKELYVRWLQLSTFLPVIRFTHLPSKYSDDSVVEIAKRLTALRQKTVTPLLKKYANETLDTGLPIIRPLWMLDPTDPACHVVVDEFSVGEELIVAPILYSGSRQREVYLPAGVWRDGIDGSLRKGSRWIHNYRVAEDKVAYFVKMPDNTRF